MSATNLLSSDKGQNFLPPPAIFLSEATSDGEDTADDNNVNSQGPRLIKCEAVLTDVEYSSDEDEVVRKCVTPAAVNCSSESQVVERILERNTQAMNDELTDTENLNASDDDMFDGNTDDIIVDDVDVGEEDGITTISDKVKTNSKNRYKFGNVPKNVDIRYPRCEGNADSSRRINYADFSINKDYLAPVNKLAKKKKRKGKLLLDSCLTDTEDVDVPSDVDDINRVSKKDTSFNIFPSEKEEQEYTNRIKHTSSIRGSEKFTLVEFLTNKLEESGVTDIDEIAYSECEDAPEVVKETVYEVDFSNEVSNKESVIQPSTDRKLKKKRATKNTPNSADSDDDDDSDEFSRCLKHSQRIKSNDNLTGNHLTVNKAKHFKIVDEISNNLTDTEDINYSDGEYGSSRPKCPTPEMAFLEDSTVLLNESVKIMKALEVISDADPLTDCEEILLSVSPRKPLKKQRGECSTMVGEGHTDTEELMLSDGGNARMSELSDTEGDSCSETDVELCSNLGEILDELRHFATSVTPDCLRIDNTYICNIEGSEAYLKQIKGKRSKSPCGRSSPLVCPASPSHLEHTDSEEIQTEDETAEEFTYNRACTPSNYFEKFHLEDESSVIHEKNTRSFQTDGPESLHIKGATYQQDPVTDSEEVPLMD